MKEIKRSREPWCWSTRVHGFWLGVLITAILIFTSACGDGDSDEASFSCELSVLTHEETVLENETVSFSEGDSALDILIAAVQEAKLQLEYDGTGGLAYVRGINDLYEFDEGPESGWVYTVNGERINESAGSFTPEDGDIIVWQYIVEQ
jgi:hypothetical protein